MRGSAVRAARHPPRSASAQLAIVSTVLVGGVFAAAAVAVLIARAVGLPAAFFVLAVGTPLSLGVLRRSALLQPIVSAGRMATVAQRFERGFDDAAIGMVMLSPEMRVLRANAATCEILGRGPQQVVGRSTWSSHIATM